MEEMLCARALKSANGPAEPPHSIWPVVLSGERALKSAGERNTHNQVGAGTFGPRETACTGGRGVALHGIDGGDLAAGDLFPCWQITDRKYRLALRAAATKSASRS